MPAAKARNALSIKKVAKGTPSRNRYRFESFTQRIAALSINPVTKARIYDLDESTDGQPISHFVTTFTKWKELNLSSHFVKFAEEIEPISETYPQVLHYQDQIVDKLVTCIDQGDVLSLEPLLELASALAHDLGYRFEGHFPRVLAVILAASTAHVEVEVVEWSFSALAWLFKYLSRLIVPDIRPTFDVVAPFLGKSHHKAHIARFAAEALSFLIRKAAARRDTHSLRVAVQHIFGDASVVLQDDENETYLYGLMTLFANAMKGVDQGLHSSAAPLLEALLSASSSSASRRIVVGVLINLIHYANSQSLLPVLQVLCDYANRLDKVSPTTHLHLAAESFFYTATVRDGVKISQWDGLVASTTHLLSLVPEQSATNTEECRVIERTVIAMLANASLDVAIPYIRKILSSGSQDMHISLPISLLYFRQLNSRRFEELVMPNLGNLVQDGITESSQKLLVLHVLLPSIRKKQLPWPEAVVASCLTPLLDQSADPTTEIPYNSLAYMNTYLDTIPSLPFDARIRGKLAEELEKLISFGETSQQASRVLLGNGLRSLLETGFTAGRTLDIDKFIGFGSTKLDHPQLLRNLQKLHSNEQLTLQQLQEGGVFPRIYSNLSSTCKDVRLETLKLLHQLAEHQSDARMDLIDAATSIEELSDNPQSARKIAMYTRQMTAISTSLGGSSWLQPLLPYYCFGMMTFHLADAWTAAVEALRIASESSSAETIIMEVLNDWLTYQAVPSNTCSRPASPADGRIIANEFQCFKAENAKRQFDLSIEQISAPYQYFEENLCSDLGEKSNNIEVRTQALRILKGLPKLAEKRSRLLVPLFLEWTKSEDAKSKAEETESKRILNVPKSDTLAFLETFALFQNPRSLFKAEEVYERLLELLSSSDAAIQTRTLNAVLTWKQPAVREFEEAMHNMLDETRFRETLMDFTHVHWARLSTMEHRDEAVIVLLRLLFGRLTASLKSTGSSTQQGRRRAILEFLYKFEDQHIRYFLFIATESVGASVITNKDFKHPPSNTASTNTCRRLLGLLKLLTDMVLVLGDRLKFLAAHILDVILRAIESTNSIDFNNSYTDGGSNASLPSTVRSQGLHCLVLWFQYLSGPQSGQQISKLFQLLVDQRVDDLAVENSQSISHLFRLFSAWATDPSTRHLLVHNLNLLQHITETLKLSFAKEEVKLFVLDTIIGPLLDSGQAPAIVDAIDRIHGHLISCCEYLLQTDLSRHLLASTIKVSLQLSPFITKEAQVLHMLKVLTLLIRKPSNQVMNNTKIHVLEFMRKLLPAAKCVSDSSVYLDMYDCLGNLLAVSMDSNVRSAVCQTFRVLTEDYPKYHEVSVICSDLSAFSSTELDSPDFERRRKAFDIVCSERVDGYTARQWSPILQTLLYFAKDPQDFDMSTNARIAVCGVVSQLSGDDDKIQLIPRIILPALKLGVRAEDEQVRKNCLEITAHIVQCHPAVQEISDLTPLLMNNDEEASIFNNIFHVQQHRRIRALRRLASREILPFLSSKNVAQFLLPPLEYFIFDRDDDSKAGDVAAETIATIGGLAYQLDWTQARALLRRYTKYISSKPGFEKSTFQLLAVLIDAITASSQKRESAAEAESWPDEVCPLMQSISRKEKLSADVVDNLLPPLTSYLHHKDESVVSLRAPVAISVAKLLMILPSDAITLKLPPVLTDICHILRSRAVESRDLVRKTLGEISQVIGANYFGFIIKELRAALARGYQLHVLSFTAHTLLVDAIPAFETGDLDYCVDDLSGIIMDDIFGTTGKEKEADEYTGKMKEIKSRKSFDSMELLASNISISSLGPLVQPIQTLLQEKLDLKTIRKADELLRRFASGLAKNAGSSSHQSLVFCYELIQRSFSTAQMKNSRGASRQDRFLVNLKGKKANNYRASGTLYDFKLLAFAFDLIRMLVQKHEELRTPSQLSGFLPAIGDAMLKAHEDVQVAAMRLLAAVLKIQIPDLDKNGPVYLAEATKAVKLANSLNTEFVQAALKLITAYLRERPDVAVNEHDVAQILKTISMELDRSETQGMIFNFLKSVLGRKMVIAEVYEVMDNVATMMVTHMSRDTRAMARAAYIQFLLNYPQGSKRLQKQIGFLRSNLQYPHVEGRQAIMEALHVLLPRVDPDLQQEIIATFFNPLVLVLVNDESADCRKMAGLLIESLLKSTNEETSAETNAGILKWLSQTENLVLLRAGFQTCSILVDVAPQKVEQQHLHFLTRAIVSTIQLHAFNIEDPTWELLYYALQLWKRLLNKFEDYAVSAETEDLWALIQQTVSFPHKWVKMISATLVETYLSEFAQVSQEDSRVSWPINAAHGLTMTKSQALSCLKRLLKGLHSPDLTEELADQLVRDVVLFAQIGQGVSDQSKSNEIAVDLSDHSDSEEDASDGLEEITTGPTAGADIHEQTILGRIFRDTSLMIRQEPAHSKASALIPRGAALRLCLTLCNGVPTETIRPHLQSIMLPLYNLVDPSIPTPFSIDQGFLDAWKEHVSTGREILDLLREKVGTSDFLAESSKIQARIRQRRNERRAKRKLAAITAPERTGRDKQRKGERKKERRKEKGMEFRERRRGW